MGRLIDMDIDGYLVFEDAPAEDLTGSQAREALVEFLSIRTRGSASGEWCDACLRFAREHGPLLPHAPAVRLPGGASSFFEDPAHAPCGATVRVEPTSQWASWSARMRDVALVHSWIWLPERRGEAPYARMVRDNIVSFSGPEGPMCLFRASAPGPRRHAYGELPAEIGAYLAAVGSPFAFSAPSPADGPEGRAAWMEENAKALLAALLEDVAGSPLPSDGSLLSRLRRELALLVATEKPMGFCIACGAATPARENRYPKRYDTPSHRLSVFRGRDAYVASFRASGFSKEEADRLLGGSKDRD